MKTWWLAQHTSYESEIDINYSSLLDNDDSTPCRPDAAFLMEPQSLWNQIDILKRILIFRLFKVELWIAVTMKVTSTQGRGCGSAKFGIYYSQVVDSDDFKTWFIFDGFHMIQQFNRMYVWFSIMFRKSCFNWNLLWEAYIPQQRNPRKIPPHSQQNLSQWLKLPRNMRSANVQEISSSVPNASKPRKLISAQFLQWSWETNQLGLRLSKSCQPFVGYTCKIQTLRN